MTMREHRKGTPGEGRLLVGDGVQCNMRVRDNPLAILPRNSSIVLGALGLKTFRLHPLPGLPILCCGSSAMPWASRLR